VAIAHDSTTAWSIITGDSTVTIPAGAGTGDMMLILAAWKDFSVSATVSGWTELFDSAAGGSTSNGNGTGTMRVGCWYKEHDGSEANPTLDLLSGVIGAVCMVVFSKDASETWDTPTQTTGLNESAASSLTITGAANLSLAAGDMLVGVMGVRDDSASFSHGTTGLNASGITWAANVTQQPATHASTTTGNDMSASAAYRLASSGTSSAAPTITGLLSASETGTAGFIRLRVTVSGTLFEQDLTGGLSFSGSFSKRGDKSLTGGLSFSGAFSKKTEKSLTGALSFVGALSKSIFRSLTGSLSFSGSLGASRVILKELTGSLSFSGSLVKQGGKSLTGSLSFSGAISKQTNKALAGALSFVGSLFKRTDKVLAGALSFSGSLSKRVDKVLAGGLSFVGDISKRTGKALTGALSFAGEVAGEIVPSGTLYFKELAGSLSFSGSLDTLLTHFIIAADVLDLVHPRRMVSRFRRGRTGLRPRS
jgi:hypothetical protein